MAVLFIVLIFITLRYSSDVQSSRVSYELQSQAPKIKDHILNCFSVDSNTSKADVVINRSILGDLRTFYSHREPACAEDLNYGWNATVTLEYLPGVTRIISSGTASIMLIIDKSGSMDDDPENDTCDPTNI